MYTRNKKIQIIVPAVMLVALVIIIIISLSGGDEPVHVNFKREAPLFEGYDDEDTIPEGIYVGSVYIGGYSLANARKILGNTYTDLENRDVTVYWDGEPVFTNLDSFDVSWGIEDTLNMALRIGNTGSLLRRYMNNTDLKMGTYHMECSKTVNNEKVVAFVEDLAHDKDKHAKNAKMSRGSNGFDIVEGSGGRITNQQDTVRKIMNAFINGGAEEKITVIATVEPAEPKVTGDMLRSVDSVLGSFETEYLEPGKERGSRCTNVEVATAFIDGTLVMPGETVSTSELMHDRSEENGYERGTQFYNGVQEDAIGGGICQVATTLYNAILRSELQIDKRYQHSMLVSYVKPSMDAAIATGSKDLKFTNNLEYPVYIEGYTDGHRVGFAIYGKEYRPSTHKVEYISVEDERIVSEPEIIYDDSIPKGEEQREGSQHDEVRSHLIKVTYEDGVEVSRKTLHEDQYAFSKLTVRIGTGESAHGTDTSAN